MAQGPNVRKLIVHKMSVDAVPSGGGIVDALAFISDAKNIAAGARRATEWVNAAMLAVRQAAEPNPYRGLDDEAIAMVLLEGIEKKKKEQRRA